MGVAAFGLDPGTDCKEAAHTPGPGDEADASRDWSMCGWILA